MDAKEASQLGIKAIKEKAKNRAAEIEAKAQTLNPNLSLDYTTYVNLATPCKWTEAGFGEFWRRPLSVLQQRAIYHPDHKFMRLREAGVYERTIKASREAIRQKYGVSNPSQIPGIQEKVQATKRRNGTDRRSYEEARFGEWLTSIGVEHKKWQVHHDKQQFLIDFYVPQANLAIEYNGDFWHSSGNKHITPAYHLQRTQACAARGVQLIHLFASEWQQNEKRIKQFLLSKLAPPSVQYHARKLSIVCNPKGGKQFFEDAHMQGWVSGTVYALCQGGEILSAVIIGAHHRGATERPVLRRFASAPGVQVRGALSRLSRHAARQHGPLISWVDLRWSSPAAYAAAGWQIEEVLRPDYWYWDDRNKCRISKQSRKKSVANTPEALTERQHAVAQRLHRVYDCGKVRLSFT